MKIASSVNNEHTRKRGRAGMAQRTEASRMDEQERYLLNEAQSVALGASERRQQADEADAAVARLSQ